MCADKFYRVVPISNAFKDRHFCRIDLAGILFSGYSLFDVGLDFEKSNVGIHFAESVSLLAFQIEVSASAFIDIFESVHHFFEGILRCYHLLHAELYGFGFSLDLIMCFGFHM